MGSGLSLVSEGVGALPGTMPAHYMTFTYGDVTAYGCGSTLDACTAEFNNSGSGVVQNAKAMIAASFQGNAAYLELMVHEIGHSYGAVDCADCSDTVMYPSPDTDSPQYPTCCDAEWL